MIARNQARAHLRPRPAYPSGPSVTADKCWMTGAKRDTAMLAISACMSLRLSVAARGISECPKGPDPAGCLWPAMQEAPSAAFPGSWHGCPLASCPSCPRGGV